MLVTELSEGQRVTVLQLPVVHQVMEHAQSAAGYKRGGADIRWLKIPWEARRDGATFRLDGAACRVGAEGEETASQ